MCRVAPKLPSEAPECKALFTRNIFVCIGVKRKQWVSWQQVIVFTQIHMFAFSRMGRQR